MLSLPLGNSRNETLIVSEEKQEAAVDSPETTQHHDDLKINRKHSSNAIVTDTKVDINNNDNDNHFDAVLWPQIQQEMCPGGLPKLKHGPTLFALGRAEMGIGGVKPNIGLMDVFFDCFFQTLTVVRDTFDSTNTLLYVRIWKAGNNQIRHYLEKYFGLGRLGNPQRGRKNQKTFTHAHKQFLIQMSKNNQIRGRDNRRRLTMRNPIMQNPARISNNYVFFEIFPEPKGQRYFRAIPNEQHPEEPPLYEYSTGSRKKTRKIQFTKPCVFTAIRDPISHFLSGYNEIEYRLVRQVDAPSKIEKLPEYATIPFGKLTKGEFPVLKNPDDPKMQASRRTRFKTFVKNLLQEHKAFDIYGKSYYQHLYPMSRVLNPLHRLKLLPTNEDKDKHSWILPSTDNITDNLPVFLNDRCPRFAANLNTTAGGFPPTIPEPKHKSSDDPIGTYGASKAVWKEAGPVARALCLLKAHDYACFYGMTQTEIIPTAVQPSSAIPEVCREVFASQRFRETILK